MEWVKTCRVIQEDLIDVMPAVEEANSISEELDKRVKFEIILIRFVPLQDICMIEVVKFYVFFFQLTKANVKIKC